MKRWIFNLCVVALDIFLAINYFIVGKYWSAGFDIVLAVLLLALSYDVWRREVKRAGHPPRPLQFSLLALLDFLCLFQFHPQPLFLSSAIIISQKGDDVHAIQGIQNFPWQSEIL